MDANIKTLWNDLRSGSVDINNLEMFFSALSKGFIYKLNKNLMLRDTPIPHYILNTGDDILYLEAKGQDHSVEPLEVSNENFVYSQIPRCMVTVNGVNIPTDQLTSPYSYGTFQVETCDEIHDFRAEFRRIPITANYNLKYYFDNFSDALNVTQQIIANLAFINNFDIIYLGRKIQCSYKIPDEYQTEYMMEFDGITTDSKNRTITLDLEVSSNIPVIYKDTIIPADCYIRKTEMVPGISKNIIENNTGTMIHDIEEHVSHGEFSSGITLYPNNKLNP